MRDPKDSASTPNRWPFGSLSHPTSPIEVRTTLSLEAGEYFPHKVWSSCEQIYRRGSRRYIFVPESVSPASAPPSWDQIFCCSFDSGTHPWKQFDEEGRKRQYFVASWKVISECWRKVPVRHQYWQRVNSSVRAGSCWESLVCNFCHNLTNVAREKVQWRHSHFSELCRKAQSCFGGRSVTAF